jgi:hypothetical protein
MTAAMLLLATAVHPVAASSLQPYQAQATGSWADAVAVGDIDGDGRDDIALTTTTYFDEANDFRLFVYFQNPDGSLRAPRKYSYGAASATGLALADLDRDGRKEIIVGHGGGITVFRWGYLRGKLAMSARVVEGKHRVNDVAIVDVNRDGKLDVVGQGWDDGATIFFGNGVGGFSRSIELATPAEGYDDVKTGDFNGDGFTDFAVLSGQGITDTYVYYNDGSDDFSAPTVLSPGNDATIGALASGDFNGDGRDDLAIMSDRTHIALYAQAANGTFLSPVAIASGLDPNAMVGADLDLDGKDDLIVQHGSGPLGVYLQGAGGLASEVAVTAPYATWFNTQGLAVGDVNGDGCPDVVTANYNAGLVVFPGSDCHPTADLAVSMALTAWAATIRVENRGAADALSPQVDVTMTVSGGTLSMDNMAGCAALSLTTTTLRARCDRLTIAAGGSITIPLAMSVSASSRRASLQVTAQATTTTDEIILRNNTATRQLHALAP